MPTKVRRSAMALTLVATIAGLLAGAPAADARAGHVSTVHSVSTFTYVSAPPQTFLTDHGTLSAVDDASISLLRADGVTITLAASATTCVRVDGLPASLQNLVLGQDVNTMSDATGTQALAIRAGRPKVRPNEPGCGVVGPAVHADITDTLSDGTTGLREWDRGRITGLAPDEIRILRPDGMSVVADVTLDTRVRGVRSYWRLRLGERVGIASAKQLDPTTGGVTLVARAIRVHR